MSPASPEGAPRTLKGPLRSSRGGFREFPKDPPRNPEGALRDLKEMLGGMGCPIK